MYNILKSDCHFCMCDKKSLEITKEVNQHFEEILYHFTVFIYLDTRQLPFIWALLIERRDIQ